MSSRVHKCGWFRGLALLALALATGVPGCKQNDEPDLDDIVGGSVPGGPQTELPPGCETPDVGCPCDEVGEFVSCGDVVTESGDYVSCSMGRRECTIDHVYGDCVADHLTTVDETRSSTHPLAVTGPTTCSTNPCDPYCNYVEDDGQDVMDLPPGICAAPTGGIVACGMSCGYAGPHGGSYSGLPASWKKLPATCTAAADACGYDRNCTASGACADWTFPCYDPTPPGCSLAKKIDLQLGPPCISGTTYHFQVCNRGSDRADAGTVKVGVYSMSTTLQTTLPAAAPDKGYVTFTLGTGAGKYIDPGTCLDLTNTNSTASTSPALSLTATRALAVNYDKTITGGECNYTNNWQVFEPTVACLGCTTPLDCAQTCPGANLTGTIKDPGGTNPVPGVIVYVPNGTVLPLTDGVACDTCASLYTGTPIASAVTGPDGKFTLTNVPVGINFPLVIQIGRWRRQVTVATSSFTGTCAAGTLTAALPTGETSQLPSKASEGNIPKIALSMSAGDHLECLLHKVGIEDAEFTNKNGAGRIHLYGYNGMTFTGTGMASVTGAGCTAAYPTGTCAKDLWSSGSQLDTYSAVIAPCDKNPFGGTPGSSNPYVGTSGAPIGYAAAPYVPGTYSDFGAAQAATNPLNTDKPPFLTPPDTANAALNNTPSPTHASNLKTYIDKGGRLFATHWMAYFLTQATYPAAVNYVYGSFTDNDRQGSSFSGTDFPYTLDTTNATGKAFADWATGVGASPAGYGTTTFTNWRHLVASVNSPTVRLAYGDSTATPINHNATCASARTSATTSNATPTSCNTQGNGHGGPMVSAYQFDTPWGSAAGSQCGRVVVAETHVSKSNSTTSQQGAFLPWASTTCDTAAMNGEEKAFEFLLFNATQCVGLVAPPAPATPLASATFTYDYEADCPLGTQPEWQFFYWKATVPPSTSIVFKAQTADTDTALASATQVGAGTASANATAWTSDANTVAYHLKNDPTPALVSKRWLRVSMTINPSGTTTPTLTTWKQEFDCKPAE
jgi:hypothetical protein